jgi:hypothetical protein
MLRILQFTSLCNRLQVESLSVKIRLAAQPVQPVRRWETIQFLFAQSCVKSWSALKMFENLVIPYSIPHIPSFHHLFVLGKHGTTCLFLGEAAHSHALLAIIWPSACKVRRNLRGCVLKCGTPVYIWQLCKIRKWWSINRVKGILYIFRQTHAAVYLMWFLQPFLRRSQAMELQQYR